MSEPDPEDAIGMPQQLPEGRERDSCDATLVMWLIAFSVGLFFVVPLSRHQFPAFFFAFVPVGVFYALPFFLIAAMPGWRSFCVALVLAAVGLGSFWKDYFLFDRADHGISTALADIGFFMMTTGVAAAVVGRGAMLIWRRRLTGWRALAVMIACFVAAPALVLFETVF